MDYKGKIRKLLALAKSPEPEEAKLALLKARKLMAEHKLTERDLEERNTTARSFPRKQTRGWTRSQSLLEKTTAARRFDAKLAQKQPFGTSDSSVWRAILKSA